MGSMPKINGFSHNSSPMLQGIKKNASNFSCNPVHGQTNGQLPWQTQVITLPPWQS